MWGGRPRPLAGLERLPELGGPGQGARRGPVGRPTFTGERFLQDSTHRSLTGPEGTPARCYHLKYFCSVAACGLAVSNDTTTIRTAEPIVIGATGIKPNTAVPPAVRARMSIPQADHTTVGGPGAGAG